MPPPSRAKFQAELALAAEKGIPNIHNIHKMDDGFDFTFQHHSLPLPHHVKIHAAPQDGTYLVYTDDDVPGYVAKELENSTMKAYGLSVQLMLDNLSRRLRTALEGGSGEDPDAVMTDVDGNESASGSEDDDESFDFDYGVDDDTFGIPDDQIQMVARTARPIPSSVLRRIREDFRAVRKAGFKLGVLCGFHEYAEEGIVSISVRVDKLCLSYETLQAWDLDSTEFIVLLIRFNDGHYATFEDALNRPVQNSNLEFRLRKCSRYKPTAQQAASAFGSHAAEKRVASHPLNPDEPDFSLLGIGSSIDRFMGTDFISMLKLKNQQSISWDAAKGMLSMLEKSVSSSLADIQPPLPDLSGDSKESSELPGFLLEEPVDDNGPRSLPLIATRFALRYLVRCADYCMICHRQVESNFEALKPYVCGHPLCLFQYMSLGFGPSINSEILSQPHVVDLLISFCYASLTPDTHGKPRMREYPTGLSLNVPNIRKGRSKSALGVPESYPPTSTNGMILVDPLAVFFDWGNSTATLCSPEYVGGPSEGQWVVISTSYPGGEPSASSKDGLIGDSVLHFARVESISTETLRLQIASRLTVPTLLQVPLDVARQAQGSVAGQMVLCNQNLDDVKDDAQKAFLMSLLLSVLPSVPDMRKYLSCHPHRELTNWERMVPASMGLLRWIVASNRSCIVQVDGPAADDEPNTNRGANRVVSRRRERISGVDGWVQFRFAQGSPEKEALFQEALKTVQKPQRSLLAWHGSALGNWHSIIRQGLDYSVMEHGRAFGHGVYFSRDFDTSLGYTGSHYASLGNNYSPYWPKSALKIDAAIGLAELVNQPENFNSINPHFVVQYCHWIQCRYLFVRCPSADQAKKQQAQPPEIQSTTVSTKPRGSQDEFIQDLKYPTTGPRGQRLFVPKMAIPSASQHEKWLPGSSSIHDAQGHTGDTGDEDEADIDFLDSDGDTETMPDGGSRSGSTKLGVIENLPPSPVPQEPQTDFRPGALDLSTLPQLKPPSYATEQAQRAIGRELKRLQQIQSSTPLCELGWYIDFDNISNMFQWIVELHSFDLSLPLGQDMKTAGVNSIVLEMRFGREYPMSPPFVRVIRPRFLPFLNGGGGHVTGGGAMCMELLTATGWSPANSLEAVLLQVRLALCSLDPKPARLHSVASPYGGAGRDYGVDEAFNAFANAASAHKWRIPVDLQEMRTAR
ncbi:hypothetical protein DL764_009632 [Monosporascus ibericus]|uniref:UBC core domain-containing protein n=1 Tax=Monosporascus ibericus TaxID=155417 RepID=A0A4Q4SUG3_9PEZI|nr:hypothetical protein DL764_009632 [Monosporascus ibericus]